MRDSQGPRSAKVEAGISVPRILFSTLRMEARGMRKRSSCSAIFWVATVRISFTVYRMSQKFVAT